jgi:hypothetical protein
VRLTIAENGITRQDSGDKWRSLGLISLCECIIHGLGFSYWAVSEQLQHMKRKSQVKCSPHTISMGR